MPDSQPKLVDTQKLELAVADLLIHEVTEADASDPVAIANKIIRGLNQNTVATVKTQHGVESLHERVTPLEQNFAPLAERVKALEDRNDIVDHYLKIISEAATWFKDKIGWWLLQLIKLAALGLAYLLVDYVFTRFGHPLPRSIAPSP